MLRGSKSAVVGMCLLGALVCGHALVAGEPIPEGPEFQVNTYTVLDQDDALVAFDADGAFVVVWESDGSPGTDTDGNSVQVRRYEADGTPLDAEEIQVNTYTVGAQGEPEFAAQAGGAFTIVWESDGSFGTDTSYESVQGRRYAADGSPLDLEEFQLNTHTTNAQRDAGVAIDTSGNFAVVWESDGSPDNDTSQYSAQLRRYDAAGTPLDPVEVQINTYTLLDQDDAVVAFDPAGNIIVVFESDGSAGTDTDGNSVQLRRYAADGTPLEPAELQVNTYTTGHQGEPDFGMAPDGSFVIVWESEGSAAGDTSDTSIQARRFGSDGTPIDPAEVQVNTFTTDAQEQPAVAVDGLGGFVVVWESRGSTGDDTSYKSVQARRYQPDGTPIDAEGFQVNTYTTEEQRDATVAADFNGRFVVVWESYGSSGTDSDEFSVQARFFKGVRIFADGFESGDTGAWSQAVQ